MPSLVSLAEELLSQAKKIDAQLEQNGTPYPSFDQDTLTTLPEESQKLRREMFDTSHTIRQLARGAQLSGLDIAFGWVDQLILRIIWKYNFAAAVPLTGTATFDDIAATTGLARSLVIRTIRASIPLNIFDEPHPGEIHHTAISRLMREEAGYSDSIGLQVEDIGPSSVHLLEAWEKFGSDAGEPDQSAFSLAHNGRSLFTVLAEEPPVASRFHATMKYFTHDEKLAMSAIGAAYDWASLDTPGARVVDLGGGWGQVSQTLALQTQNLTFVVQDLQHVQEEGKRRLPPELSDRVTYETWDFLQMQPAERAPRAFLISRCLHNWSDARCAVILRNLIPAMERGAKVLIWDVVLADEPVRKASERFNLQQDFIMATIANGTDRTLAGFERVLKISDQRFKANGVRRVDGCKLSMIEVTWEV